MGEIPPPPPVPQALALACSQQKNSLISGLARNAVPCGIRKVEATSGSGVAMDIEVHDIAALLHVVVPLEFNVDVRADKAQQAAQRASLSSLFCRASGRSGKFGQCQHMESAASAYSGCSFFTQSYQGQLGSSVTSDLAEPSSSFRSTPLLRNGGLFRSR
jgi:PPE-repeat protein